MAIIEARGLHKVFGRGAGSLHVLRGIDLEIEAGDVVTVVGPSGAGKSTLLHILGGLDRPTKGQILFDGGDLFRRTDRELARVRNRSVGFVFQFHHLLPEFTALENVMLPVLIAGEPKAEAAATAGEFLEAVGLAERVTHRPNELSAGEKQRVAVARALANRPRVVLADEPSGNLDRANGEMLYDMIMNLRAEYGATFVIVTHDEELAEKSERTMRLLDGKIV
jgi:lipoprotein-releasing system ATP-binding protein